MTLTRCEGGFLNTNDLAFVLGQHGVPVDSELMRVAGMDLVPRELHRVNGELLRPTDGYWNIPARELIRVRFGKSLPESLTRQGYTPDAYWRSSCMRCGGAGLSFGAVRAIDGTPMVGGELCGNFMVYNPFGMQVKEGAAMAQLTLKQPGSPPLYSETLVPDSISRFAGPGTLEPSRTILPQMSTVEPTEQGWTLERGAPLIKFRLAADWPELQNVRGPASLQQLLERHI